MTVHIDRAHHHPRVYKRLGYWQARCPRCGLLAERPAGPSFVLWRAAFIVALHHAKETFS